MGEISLAHNEAENLLALRRLESRTSAIIGYCLKLPGRTCVPGTPFRTLQEEPGTATLMGWSHDRS